MANPAFTKQHYEAIAEVIKESAEYSEDYLFRHGECSSYPRLIMGDELLRVLCAMFEEDNPLFDRKKFWEACFKEASDVLS